MSEELCEVRMINGIFLSFGGDGRVIANEEINKFWIVPHELFS